MFKEPIARAAHFVIYLLLYKYKSKSRAKRERELTTETLMRSWRLSSTLVDSRRLSCALIEIAPSSRVFFSCIFLVYFSRVFFQLSASLVLVWPQQRDTNLKRRNRDRNYTFSKRNFLDQKLNASLFPLTLIAVSICIVNTTVLWTCSDHQSERVGHFSVNSS